MWLNVKQTFAVLTYCLLFTFIKLKNFERCHALLTLTTRTLSLTRDFLLEAGAAGQPIPASLCFAFQDQLRTFCTSWEEGEGRSSAWAVAGGVLGFLFSLLLASNLKAAS